MKKIRTTRDIVKYLCTYISGDTLDFGAGGAKYRSIITPHTTSYTTFDMEAGAQIDIVGDALNPPFKDASFDTIVATQVLEHVEKPWIVVAQMARILRSGGTCIITVPFLVPYHAYPTDFFRYTKEGMESLLKNEGFTIIESGGYGNTLSVFGEMVRLSHFSNSRKVSRIRQWWRNTYITFFNWLAHVLHDKFENEAIYVNTYVVAKKN